MVDVVVVGGGPGGLSAALALGRAVKRVLLCDGGPRRNEAATHLHNFVTRDGTPPAEFRRVGREQLAAYPGVAVRDVAVEAVSGARGAFRVRLADGDEVDARRVLLCTGMIDEVPPLEGFRELWGHAIFQCPYCHGWEVRGQRWGVLVDAAHAAMFGHFATAPGPPRPAPRPARAPPRRLLREGQRLRGVELVDGAVVPCDALFAHPPQRQVDLVRALGVALDDAGYVVVDPMTGATSVPGISAAGDLTTRAQGAIFAAAAAMKAATMLNFELTAELAAVGERA